MNASMFIDAVGLLDGDLIEEHLAMRDSLIRKAAAKRTRLKIIVGLAACLVVVLGFFGVRSFINTPKPNSPDVIHYRDFSLGDTCMIIGTGNTIAFHHAYLTREVAGERMDSGGYLIVDGVLDMRDFSFDTKWLRLELSIDQDTDRTQMIRFEKEYSLALSEVELLFDDIEAYDGESGTMKGSFCFVFSIDEEHYALIARGTSQTSDPCGHQLHLVPGWINMLDGFFFRLSFMIEDVQVLEK